MFKTRQITWALFLDQPIEPVEFRRAIFFGVFPLKPEPYFQFLNLIFGEKGLVVWCMGREGRAVGRMNGAWGGFKWVDVVWLSF